MTRSNLYDRVMLIASTFGALAVALVHPAAAQTAAEFYKGKVVSLYSGHSPGGSYSTYARTMQRNIGRHLPGKPTVVFKIKTGGSGRVLANWMYNVAPRDGTVFGTFHERMGLEPRVYPKGTKFDGLKFNWIGSLAKQKSVCVTWHGNKVKTIDDALKHQIIVGSQSTTSTGAVMPRMLNSMLGTKFKLVLGYDPQEVFLAMERGELDGLCGYGWASLKIVKPDWIRDKKLNMLLQFSMVKHKELPHVPVMMDFVTDPADREALRMVFGTQEMGRPYAAPPGVPKERVQALRTAFMATTKDAKFLVEAKKRRLEIDPITGEEITALMKELYALPLRVGKRVAAFRKPMKVGESKRRITWLTVTSALTKASRRRIHFLVKGEKHQAKLSGRRTKVTIAGKKAKRKALKAGMTCAITYPGNMGQARAVACR